MSRRSPSGHTPEWAHLYEVAAPQGGYFTAKQAGQVGYSPQLLQFYLRRGHIERWGRGLLRLVHFPAAEHEELVPFWLWAEQKGIFSHETALALHELSDVLPASSHLTVPLSWSKRRLRVPPNLNLYYADLEEGDIEWKGVLPVTTPIRTILDCLRAGVSRELVDQAIFQGVRRGMFSAADIPGSVGKSLEPEIDS